MSDPALPVGPRPAVGLGTKILYGLGSVAFGIKDNGYRVFLLLFYNQVVGMDPRAVGLAITLALIIDCVIDPVLGEISDNWRSKWGRRHPFMYASALPIALSFLLLWNPPAGWSEGALFWYLVAVAVLGRSFITMYEVPSSSLAAELTEDYDERSSILGWRYFFAWWGGLTLTIVMFWVFMQPTPDIPNGQLNPAAYKTYGYAGAVLMFISILASAAGTHRFIPWLRRPQVHASRTLTQTLGQMAETLNNRPFVVITLVGLVAAIAQGVSFTLAFYFSTYFWELNSFWTGVLVLDSYFSSAIALIAAPMLSKRSGKKKAGSILLAASVLTGFLPLFLRLMGWFPENADVAAVIQWGPKLVDVPSIVPWLFLDGVVRGIFGITAAILITAMLADVVEHAEVKTGRRSEGLFFAFTSLVQKAVGGIGVMAASFLLVLIDFPRNAKPGEVDAAIITKMALVYMPVLAILYGTALAIMQLYNISRETHTENLRALAAKAEAGEAADIVP
jgi:glycoside/pentoside/hexuronide:cation symporter, GPH family